MTSPGLTHETSVPEDGLVVGQSRQGHHEDGSTKARVMSCVTSVVFDFSPLCWSVRVMHCFLFRPGDSWVRPRVIRVK